MEERRQVTPEDRVRREEEGEGVGLLALLLDTDLFFSVKVTDTLKHIGYTTKTHRRLEDFTVALASEDPTLALVNTGGRGVDWRSGIAAAVAASVPVVAFGSHVDLTTQHEARDLGATSVIANSKLASDLPGVVARTLRRTQQHKE
jgi:DNA-binding response OmpR family regulator